MSSIKLPPLVEVDAVTRAKVLALASEITAVTGVEVDAMIGRDRSPQATNARYHLMALLWRSGLSIAEVGAVLGRHHTVVMYGLRQIVPPAAYQAEVLSRYPASRRGSYRGQVST